MAPPKKGMLVNSFEAKRQYIYAYRLLMPIIRLLAEGD